MSSEQIQQIPQELLESGTATLDPPGGDESQGKSPPALSTRGKAAARRQVPTTQAATQAATKPPAPPKPPASVATAAGDARTPRKIIQDALDALVASKQAKIIAMQSMGEPRQSDGVPGYTPREQDEIVLRIVYVIDR